MRFFPCLPDVRLPNCQKERHRGKLNRLCNEALQDQNKRNTYLFVRNVQNYKTVNWWSQPEQVHFLVFNSQNDHIQVELFSSNFHILKDDAGLHIRCKDFVQLKPQNHHHRFIYYIIPIINGRNTINMYEIANNL